MKKDLFLCFAVIGMLTFTACNSSTQNTTQQSSVEITSEQQGKSDAPDDKQDKDENSTMAKVTAVTDHSISVVIANMPKDKPNEDGSQPDKKDNSNEPSDKEKPAAPPNEGNAPEGNAPDSNAPAPKDTDNPQGHSLEFGTDETLIEIPDESILYTRDKDSETGCSLSDIKVDDVVRIKYSDDGVTPEKIVVVTQSAPAGESSTQSTTSAN